MLFIHIRSLKLICFVAMIWTISSYSHEGLPSLCDSKSRNQTREATIGSTISLKICIKAKVTSLNFPVLRIGKNYIQENDTNRKVNFVWNLLNSSVNFYNLKINIQNLTENDFGKWDVDLFINQYSGLNFTINIYHMSAIKFCNLSHTSLRFQVEVKGTLNFNVCVWEFPATSLRIKREENKQISIRMNATLIIDLKTSFNYYLIQLNNAQLSDLGTYFILHNLPGNNTEVKVNEFTLLKAERSGLCKGQTNNTYYSAYVGRTVTIRFCIYSEINLKKSVSINKYNLSVAERKGQYKLTSEFHSNTNQTYFTLDLLNISSQTMTSFNTVVSTIQNVQVVYSFKLNLTFNGAIQNCPDYPGHQVSWFHNKTSAVVHLCLVSPIHLGTYVAVNEQLMEMNDRVAHTRYVSVQIAQINKTTKQYIFQIYIKEPQIENITLHFTPLTSFSWNYTLSLHQFKDVYPDFCEYLFQTIYYFSTLNKVKNITLCVKNVDKEIILIYLNNEKFDFISAQSRQINIICETQQLNNFLVQYKIHITFKNITFTHITRYDIRLVFSNNLSWNYTFYLEYDKDFGQKYSRLPLMDEMYKSQLKNEKGLCLVISNQTPSADVNASNNTSLGFNQDTFFNSQGTSARNIAHQQTIEESNNLYETLPTVIAIISVSIVAITVTAFAVFNFLRIPENRRKLETCFGSKNYQWTHSSQIKLQFENYMSINKENSTIDMITGRSVDQHQMLTDHLYLNVQNSSRQSRSVNEKVYNNVGRAITISGISDECNLMEGNDVISSPYRNCPATKINNENLMQNKALLKTTECQKRSPKYGQCSPGCHCILPLSQKTLQDDLIYVTVEHVGKKRAPNVKVVDENKTIYTSVTQIDQYSRPWKN